MSNEIAQQASNVGGASMFEANVIPMMAVHPVSSSPLLSSLSLSPL
jgi:hypothetical protein